MKPFCRRFWKNSHAAVEQKRRRASLQRPFFEILEIRTMLATITWDGGGDGTSWSDAANWDDAGADVAPVAGDDVVIDFAPGVPFMVNLDVDVPEAEALGGFILNSTDATFSGVNREFAVDGPANLQAGNVDVNNFTWAGAGVLTNDATLRVIGATTISAPFVQNGALNVEGVGFGSRLTIAEGFTNSGVITLDNVNVNSGNGLVVNSGALTNAASGVITIVAGGRQYDFQGDLTNLGTVNINQDLRFSNNGASVTNANSFSVAAGASVTFAGNPNVGQPGGVFDQGGGVLDVEGQIEIIGGEFNFNGGTVDGSVTLTTSALNIGAGSIGTAEFSLRGPSSTLRGDVAQGQMIRIDSVGNSTIVTADQGFTNSGAIILERIIGVASVNLTVNGGPLVNSQTGSITTDQGNGGNAAIDADLINNGTVTLNTNTQFNGGSTQNNASFTVSAGVDATFGAAGTPAHTFSQNEGTLDIQGSFAMVDDVLNFDGGEINGVIPLTSSALNIGAGANSAAEFSMRGPFSTISGRISENHVIRVESFGVNNAILTANAGLTNAGTLIIERVAGVRSVGLTVGGGNLLNEPTGSITTEPGNGAGAVIDADIVNQGAITLNTDTRFDGDSTDNDGAFTVSAGSRLSIGAAGATAHVFQQNAGVLDIQGEVLFDQDTFAYSGGNILGVPDVGRSVLTLNTPNPATFRLLQNVALNGSVSVGQKLIVEGNVDGGLDFTNFGEIVLDPDAFNNGSDITVDGVFTNAGQVLVNDSGGADATITAALDNSGTITLNDNLQINRNNDRHFNAGTIVLNDSTLRFNGGGSSFTNTVGTIGGVGVLDVNQVSFTNAATLAPGFSPGKLDIVGDVLLTPTSEILIELAGLTAGTLFDQLNISGTAELAGRLFASLVDDFTPTVGDRFDVLTFADSNGAFSEIAFSGTNVLVAESSDPAKLTLEVARAVSDLEVQDVSVPSDAVAGEEITISYTVINRGEPTTAGGWRDSVFISEDERFDPAEDQLFARVPHTGDLANLESYSESVTALLPAVLPGKYHIIVVNDSGREVGDVDLSNNVGVSAEKVCAEVTELTFGAPRNGRVVAGQVQLFRVLVPLGGDVRIQLNAPGGQIAAVAGQRVLPNFFDAQFFRFAPGAGGQELLIDGGAPGEYFILLAGLEACGVAGCDFDITADLVGLEIREFTPTQVGATGNKTFTIDGSGFDEGIEVLLINRNTGEEIAAIEHQLLNPRRLSATFSDAPVGEFDLLVRQGEETASLGIVNVFDNAGQQAELSYRIIAPQNVRPSRDVPVQVEFTNTGPTDIPAQLLMFTVVGGTVRFPDDLSGDALGQILLFAANQNGVASILPPGHRQTMELIVRPDNDVNSLDMTVEQFDRELSIANDPPPALAALGASAARESSLETTQEFDNILADQFDIVSARDLELAVGVVAQTDKAEPVELDPNFFNLTFLGNNLTFVPSSEDGVFEEASGRPIFHFREDPNLDFSIAVLFSPSCALVFDVKDDRILRLRAADSLGEESFDAIQNPINGQLLGFNDPEGKLRDILVFKAQVLVFFSSGAADIMGNSIAAQTGSTVGEAVDGILQSTTNFNNSPGGKTTPLPVEDVQRQADKVAGRFDQLVDAEKNGSFGRGVADLKQNAILGLGKDRFEVTIFGQKMSLKDGVNLLESGESRVVTLVVTKNEGAIDATVFLSQGRSRFQFDFRGGKLKKIIEDDPQTGEPVESILNYDDSGTLTSILTGGETVELKCEDGKTTEINRGGGSSPTQSTKIDYDSDTNTVSTVTDPRGNATTFTTSEDKDTVTDADGNTTEISKDSLGRVTNIFDADENEFDVTYDDDTITLSRLDENGMEETIRLFLDENGKVEQIETSNGDVIVDPGSIVQELIEFDDLEQVLKQFANTKEQEINKALPKAVNRASDAARDVSNQKRETARLEQSGQDICADDNSSQSAAMLRHAAPLSAEAEEEATCPPETVAQASSEVVGSFDPNDMNGPAGFGDQNFITRQPVLPYTIRYENVATATAPAQEVFITQQLDPDLDFTSFELGDIGFGDFFFDIPQGRSFFQGVFDLSITLGVLVELTAGVNVNTGLASWTFRSLDPNTGDLPFDALAGFLPPNVNGPEGEGFVNYTIFANDSVVTGDVIDAQATIVFDTNDPIDTPAIFNTIDDGVPLSSVDPLPPITNSTTFTVSWSGEDDPGGSGIASFDVFVSEDGGPFTLLLDDTTDTSIDFMGEDGRRYGFLSVATDNVGFVQPTPQEQAFTVVDVSSPIADAGGPYVVNEGGSIVLDASGSFDPNQDTTSLTFEWDLDGDGVFAEIGAAAQHGNEIGIAPTFFTRDLDGPASITIDLLVTDDNSATSNDTATINITNVAPINPTIVADATFGVSGQPFPFDFNAQDSSDLLTFEIDWGDGSDVDQFIAQDVGVGAAATHFFAPPAFEDAKADPLTQVDYTITATPIDDDGARGPSTTMTVNIAHLRQVGDDLHIGGTSERDGVFVFNEGNGQDPGGDDATIQITSEGFPFIPGTTRGDMIRTIVPNPAGKYVLWAGPGNDIIGQFTNFTIDVSDGGKIPDFDNPRTSLTHPTEQHGGPGSDLLTGGTSDDVLIGDEEADNIALDAPGRIDRIFGLDGDDRIFGGLGDDRLRGHSGRDYIAGEIGSDRILGDNGNDILDGGDDRDALDGLRNDDIILAGPGDDRATDNRGGFTLFIGGPGFDILDSTRSGGNAIFIPGTTTYDAIDPANPFDSALVDLLAEWSTVNGDIDQIVNNLTTGDDGRLQPLNAATVFDDAATDFLIADRDAANPLGPDLFFELNDVDDFINVDALLNEIGPLANDRLVDLN